MVEIQNQQQETSYIQTLTDWALKGFSLVTRLPKIFETLETETVNLLENFKYSPENGIEGTIEAIKARKVIKIAMEPLSRLFVSGVLLTGTLFFASRVICYVPIIPTALFSLSLVSGLITWDIYAVVRGMKQAFTHLNRIHLQGIKYKEKTQKKEPATLTFEQIVAIIDSYSQQILCDTWLISQCKTMQKSLTNTIPHLEEQVKNLAKEGTERKSPWQIAETHFPILALVNRISNVTKSKTCPNEKPMIHPNEKPTVDPNQEQNSLAT